MLLNLKNYEMTFLDDISYEPEANDVDFPKDSLKSLAEGVQKLFNAYETSSLETEITALQKTYDFNVTAEASELRLLEAIKLLLLSIYILDSGKYTPLDVLSFHIDQAELQVRSMLNNPQSFHVIGPTIHTERQRRQPFQQIDVNSSPEMAPPRRQTVNI